MRSSVGTTPASNRGPTPASPPLVAGLDRPWHRPGARRYALNRLKRAIRPPVTVYEPDPGSVVHHWNVPVSMRDGVVLRANVFRPPGETSVPVLLSAHPYGKDRLPSRRGRRSKFPFQYRLMQQSRPLSFSTLTSWEAPDPAWWVAQGYAVINADTRGAGKSDGVGELMSDQEGEDIYDLIEWAAGQAWSSGSVGMLGISYLAMSQYKAAALRPPHLKAICPWEGMSDAYRDLMRPGGLCEDGFARIWSTSTQKVARLHTNIGVQQRARPLRDDWWQSLVPDVAKINVPILICTSFSDNNMHSRGSFRAFAQVSSTDKFAYTHRSGKWSTFYSDPARTVQLNFFDRYLRGTDTPPPPRVRLEVREDQHRVTAIRDEAEWPLARTEWTPLYLTRPGRLAMAGPDQPGSITFATRSNAAAFDYTIPTDMELTGPMALHLWVESPDRDDLDLTVGVEKWQGGKYIGFDGSYGFGRDRVATGWQKVSLRELDTALSTAAEPVHTYTHPELLTAGQIVPVRIALGPSATMFRAGETLRLVIAGRWLSPINPLTGNFPTHFRRSPSGHATLHWGPNRPAHLLLPNIPLT
jgi:predicted acyl esterase